MSDKLLEIKEYRDAGYSPVVDYASWRVAVLNYDEELLPANINNMQRHDETDEVFVLLSGKCILFIGDGKDSAGNITAVDMLPEKIYNVKKGVWHNHSLSNDGKVLIVENVDTEDDVNSPYTDLNREQVNFIIKEGNKMLNITAPWNQQDQE
ncbi:MAG: hypothetical protein JW982_15485 [Spirochaetes bacterium]|nr:hypothetical protein [Spirochaetota bacterium]